MKSIIIFLAFYCVSGVNFQTTDHKEIELISKIVNSKEFTISIERLDLGYFHNKQDYIFECNENGIFVTHKHLVANWENATLNNTSLKVSVKDSLIDFCSEVKEFELTKTKKHNRLFNKSGVHDYIYVMNKKDTVIISDVKTKAMKKFHSLISTSRN